MFSKKVLTIMSFGATILSIGGGLLSNWVGGQLNDKFIKDEVAKAVDKALNNR